MALADLPDPCRTGQRDCDQSDTAQQGRAVCRLSGKGGSGCHRLRGLGETDFAPGSDKVANSQRTISAAPQRKSAFRDSPVLLKPPHGNTAVAALAVPSAVAPLRAAAVVPMPARRAMQHPINHAPQLAIEAAHLPYAPASFRHGLPPALGVCVKLHSKGGARCFAVFRPRSAIAAAQRVVRCFVRVLRDAEASTMGSD